MNRNKMNKLINNWQFVIVGIRNYAGIMSNIDSFDNWLTEMHPAMFSIQETKVASRDILKSKILETFQLYEHIRSTNPGQGAASPSG